MSDAPERIWIEMGNIARVTLMDTELAITYEKQVLFDGEYVRADLYETLEAERDKWKKRTSARLDELIPAVLHTVKERDRYKREADCTYMHDPGIYCTECGWFREALKGGPPGDVR